MIETIEAKINGKKYKFSKGVTLQVMAIHNMDELKKRNEEKNVDIRIVHIATEVKFDGKLEDWKGL